MEVQNDGTFLKINQDDVTKFEHSMLCVDPRFYSRHAAGRSHAGGPVSWSRRLSGKSSAQKGLIVHRQGYSTGSTMDLLIIENLPPQG